MPSLTETVKKYKSLSFNSVHSMLTGMTDSGVQHAFTVGDKCNTGGTKWKVTSLSSPMTLANFKPLTPVLLSDYANLGESTSNTTLINELISYLSEIGGGTIYDTGNGFGIDGDILYKSNVLMYGVYSGRGDEEKGSRFIKLADCDGVRFGNLEEDRVDNIDIRGWGVDGKGFGGKGWSLDNLHYFNLDMLWSVNNNGEGFDFYYTWSGTVGFLYSKGNTKNYRIFYQTNSVQCDHLYSSSANKGSKIGLDFGGSLGWTIDKYTHEGEANYPVNLLGYMEGCAINSMYLEFDYTNAGIIQVIRSNGVDETQLNHSNKIGDITMIVNNIVALTSPLISILNNHDIFEINKVWMRLQGSADISSQDLIRFNQNTLSGEIKGARIKNVNIEDETTGGSTVYAVFFQGITTPDATCENITCTKPLTVVYGSDELDPSSGVRLINEASPTNLKTPRWIGEDVIAASNRSYKAIGKTITSWSRLSNGDEMVQNANFDAEDGWDVQGNCQITGGVLDYIFGVGVADCSQQLDVESGKTYRIRFNVTGYTAGNVDVSCGGVAIASINGNGSVDTTFVAISSTKLLFSATEASNMNVTYCSVKEEENLV